MAKIWEGKWVKNADSEVSIFWALVSISGLVLVVKHLLKIGLNRDLNHSGLLLALRIHLMYVIGQNQLHEAMWVDNAYNKMPHALTCCISSPHAQPGTIGFVAYHACRHQCFLSYSTLDRSALTKDGCR